MHVLGIGYNEQNHHPLLVDVYLIQIPWNKVTIETTQTSFAPINPSSLKFARSKNASS